jgi:hypothetical protein
VLIPDEAYDALVDAGVDVAAEVLDDGRVGVRVGVPGAAPTLALEVRRYTQALTPHGVVDARAAVRGRGLLLVTPSASAETVRRAAELGVSLLALRGRAGDGVHGHLALGPGDVVPLGRAATVPAQARRRTGVPARGELQVVKTLLLFGGRTQTEIARWASVTQPRVSQVLKRLAARGLVDSTPTQGAPAPSRRTWTVVDREGLLRHWLAGYPGPGGVTTYWYGLDAPVRQVRAATGVLEGRRVLVSGDVAADAIAPWARPARAVVYTDAGADLSAAGLTPCPAADATLALAVPEEAEIWRFAQRSWTGRDQTPGGLPLADPLLVLHDTRRSPSADADQATETLIARILDRRPTAPANPDAEGDE